MANPKVIDAGLHIRLARPALDLAASRSFYVDGLGLDELWSMTGDPARGEWDLLMVGPAGGGWHLELTYRADELVVPAPTPEDLLVVYLDGPVPEEAVTRAVAHGGTVVPSLNPYWDEWGVTIADPDGYRLVLCRRSWP
jgi:catechol 2,3-dioxygenase-like lactoylglutathione lyase family enzyme